MGRFFEKQCTVNLQSELRTYYLGSELTIRYEPVLDEPVILAILGAVAYDEDAVVQLGTAAVWFIIHSYQRSTLYTTFPSSN